jgi:NAD-dependent deacetylase
LEAGARLIVMNGEPTPYDDAADALISSDIVASLTALVAAVRTRID